MKKFSEFPFSVRLGAIAAFGAAIVLAGEFFYFPLASGTTEAGAPAGSLGDMRSANNQLQAKLDKARKDNEAVKPIEQQFRQLKIKNEQLEQQLANLRSIVPEDKDADAYIRMLQEAGLQSGISIRNFNAKPVALKEFYSEMPFDISLDGNYYSVLAFFDRLGKLSRISNISNLAVGPIGGAVRNVPRRYAYSPNETVLASCTVTTFFSRETQPAAPAKK